MKRALLLCASLAAACSHGTRVEPGGPTPGGPTPGEPAHRDGDLGTTPGAGGPVSPAAAPAPLPSKVKLIVRTTPPKVFVTWGKKKLGITPLTIERPRDSGPVDLVLKAVGFFPIHTRAYTVRNDVIVIKMVKLQDRMTIFGAKQEIPPDIVPPQAGAPADPALDPANALKPAPAPAPTQ